MAARWGFLRTPLARVRGLLGLQPATIERQERLCLHLKAPEDSSPSNLRAIVDAVLLLSLLGQLDAAALQLVLKEMLRLDTAPFKAKMEEDPDYLQLHRVVLKLDDDIVSGEWDREAILELFGALDEKPTARLGPAVQQIQRITRRRVQLLQLPIALLVTMCPEDSSWLFSSRDFVLEALLELRRENRSWVFNVNSEMPSSRVTLKLDVDAIDLDVTSEGLPELVADIIEDIIAEGGGVTFSKIKVNQCIYEEAEFESCIGLDTKRLSQFFEGVVCANVRPRLSLAKIDSLVINTKAEGCVDFAFPRLCTALATAKTVTSIEVNLHDQQMVTSNQWYYKYLTYAFFSKIARTQSSVKHVKLTNVDLEELNAAAVAEMLGDNDDIRHIFGWHRGVRRARTDRASTWIRAIVKREAEIEIRPETPEISFDGGDWELATAVSNALVLSHANLESGPDTAVVLMPGYGVCSVDRNDLIPIGTFNPNSPIDRFQGIESLDIEFHPLSWEYDVFTGGLAQFLSLIGASLIKLRLAKMDSYEFDINNVLQNCPRLQSLSVSGSNVVAVDLIKGCEDLGIKLKAISCEFDNVRPLLEELSSNQSGFAKNIMSLECVGTESGFVLDAGSDVDAVVSMLRSNQTLSYVRLAVRESIYERMHATVKPFQNQPLPRMRKQLPLLCRLAFLSVFSAEKDRKTKRGRQGTASLVSSKPLVRPSDVVMAIIFSFAADCVGRRVDLISMKRPARGFYVYDSLGGDRFVDLDDEDDEDDEGGSDHEGGSGHADDDEEE